MTAPPYLTRSERSAVETALRAAGFVMDGPVAFRAVEVDRADLREVFPSPWTVPQTGETSPCPCGWAEEGINPRCPVHGEAS